MIDVSAQLFTTCAHIVHGKFKRYGALRIMGGTVGGIQDTHVYTCMCIHTHAHTHTHTHTHAHTHMYTHTHTHTHTNIPYSS